MSELKPKDLIKMYPEIDFLVAEGNVSSRYMIAIHNAFYQFAAEQINGGAVLDVGCGTGFGTLLLADKAEYAVGIDIKDKLIQYGMQKYQAGGLSFEVMDANKLEFQNESFDVVVINELLEHLSDHRPCLNEILRVLRPGGMLISATVNRKHTFGTADNPLNRNHFREFDAEGFTKEIGNYFEDIKLLGQGCGEDFHDFVQNKSARGIERFLMMLKIKHKIPASWRSRIRGWITGVHTNGKQPEEFPVSDNNVEKSLYLVAIARKKK